MKYRVTQAAAAAAFFLLFSMGLRAQSGGIVDVSGGAAGPQSPAAEPPKQPFWSETAGQANVALEGYYLSGSGQPLSNASGVALSAKEYLPGIGVLDAAIEGSGGGGFHTGTMFLALEQAPFLGWHWDFRGGDSQVSSNVLGNSINNVSTPDISTRGFSVAMKRTNRTYQFFYGDDTLLSGERVAYRVKLPQKVFGVTMKQSIGKRWNFGLRFLHLDTNSSVLTTQSNFFFPGHVFQLSNSIALQASYSITKKMTLFGEVNDSRATPFQPAPTALHPLSIFAGWAWETARFTFRANYVSQGVSYLPLLGYFSGDRQGPTLEGHFHVTRNIELNGSGDSYSNNLERNPLLPTFHSSGLSGGGSLTLPWELSVSASISTLHLTTLSPSQSPAASDNHQINAEVSRQFGRHNLRFSYIQLKLNDDAILQSEHFTEVEDTFTWKRFLLRGAVRYQGSQTTDTRNTLFVRGAIQANLKRVSVYADFEKGSDLVNRSVFSTNAYTTTVIGFSIPLRGGWSLQAETFRNILNTSLNAENVFLFPTAGLAVTQLPGFLQWSGYFRIGKTFRWGNKLSASGGIDAYAAARVPLVGSVQGQVTEAYPAGKRPSKNVAVSLDALRTAVTDSLGNYTFNDVPEGPHVVGLDTDRMPTNYEAGPNPSATVTVQPRSLVRSDFTVVRLIRLTGKITAPRGIRLDDLVIRLSGTSRYTTPDEDGDFGFYNLRAADYVVAIDPQTIPAELQLSTPGSLQVPLTGKDEIPTVVAFGLEFKPPPEKPIRQMLQEQIHVGSAAKPASKPAATPAAPKTPKPKKTTPAKVTPAQPKN